MTEDLNTELIITKNGRFLIVPKDTIIGKSLKYYGEYAEHEMMLLSRWVQSEDTVLDIGANTGTHAVFFLIRSGQWEALLYSRQNRGFSNCLRKICLKMAFKTSRLIMSSWVMGQQK